MDLGENYSDPMRFVECVQVADEYAFDTAWFGDHLLPFFHSKHKISCPFIWSVFGVALERTRTIKTGPDVTSPIGGRIHPYVIAQATATLDNMYPGRFLLGVGSGEGVNEARFFQAGYPKWN